MCRPFGQQPPWNPKKGASYTGPDSQAEHLGGLKCKSPTTVEDNQGGLNTGKV